MANCSMAKGKDSDDYVILSSVRTGLKREFEFAFKSRSEITGSLGRTRRSSPGSGPNPVPPRDDWDSLAEEESDELSDGLLFDEERKDKSSMNERSELEPDKNVEQLGSLTGQMGQSVSVDQTPETVINGQNQTKPLIVYRRTRFRKKPVPVGASVSVDKAFVGEASIKEEEDEVLSHSGKRVTTTGSEPKAAKISETEAGDSTPAVAAAKPKASQPKPGKKFPARLKELLDTGILEGQHVRYIKGPKAREAGDLGLGGVITGSGILCHCRSCLGTEIVTPTVFEIHAGSANKRPPEYIYLDNKKSLRDIINVCQDSRLVNLEENVRLAIGVFVIRKCSICFNCQKSISGTVPGKSKLLCNMCVDRMESQPYEAETVGEDNRHCFKEQFAEQDSGANNEKDNRLHKLVFEDDILPDGTEVAYYSRGEKPLIGYKMGSGIMCSCCKTEVSPSQFEAHAGCASRRKPYLHIYTSNGVSLHELAISLIKQRKFSNVEKDDLCNVCCDGEDDDFVFCNGCPRAFHEWCIGLTSKPSGDWYCKMCANLFEKEKNIEHSANARAAGRLEGVDSIEQIANRCIRIVNTHEFDFGGCSLCKGHEFSKSGFDSRTILFCDQCEREFHVGCLKEYGIEDLKEIPEGLWFCSSDCRNINFSLERSVVQSEENLPDSVLQIINQKKIEVDLNINTELDMKWKIISRKVASNDETDSLLSQAMTIFLDRFTPIIDPSTKRDLIPEMLFGNSIMGQDFANMFCAVLTLNKSVASVGIFRVYGSELVELPLVATNSKYQGQGYFQAWFSCFQRLLTSLKVKNIVLPAAAEAESIWTEKFGFKKLTNNQIDEYKKQYQITMFQETTMLRKKILE